MYYIVTLAFWTFLYYVPKRNILKFEQAYMISRTAKLIIYALIFAVVLLCGLEKNIKFAFAYLGLYLVYMIFDTITTMQTIREHKQENNR